MSVELPPQELRGPLRIERLLEMDADNADVTLREFRAFDPGLLDLLDEAASLYVTISRAFGQGATDDASQRAVNECADALGTHGWDDLLPFVEGTAEAAPAHQETLEAARRALDESWSRRVRGLLLSIAYRAYMWAVTDLIRLRATPAVGYGRVQAEAIGLAVLFVESPALAKQWFEIVGDVAGEVFYRSTQGRLKETLRRLGLTDAYNLGSATALHARASSIAEGFSQRTYVQPGRMRLHEMSVSFQEVSRESPYRLLLRALWLLRLQVRIFGAFVDGMPEVTDPLLTGDRLPGFRSRVMALSNTLEARFPEQVAALRARKGGEDRG